MKFIFRFIFPLILVLPGCMMNNIYYTANELYNSNNYVVAIEQYDNFISKAKNGALATKAELERSDCYYQLGLIAYEKRNWILAKRLFYLANSKIADEKLDNCLYELSKISMQDNNIVDVMKYYDQIIAYLPSSELIPEILHNRIKIFIEQDDKDSAAQEYHLLWSKYPDNSFTQQAQPHIDKLMPYYIKNALTYQDSGQYQASLSKLYILEEYPTTHKEDIRHHISDIYFYLAQKAIEQQDYKTARTHYLEAVEFNEARQHSVEARMKNICEQIIKNGNQLISDYKIDEAIETFRQCYLLLPDYYSANVAISNAKNLKIKFTKSANLKEQATQYEHQKDYKNALKLYKQSHALIPTNELKQKIFQMRNYIEAEKDPKGFAQKIILEYQKGKIPERIYDIESKAISIYGKDMVEISGWKVLYSFGKYKYELRYDIITPKDNYYFIWRVNLIDRTISPMNKTSEELLKG